MKNKARLSEMTAFSFGYHHLKTGQPYPFKRVTIRFFCLRFTSQNETTKSSLIPTLITPLITMQ